ncbi:DUF1758 domain-containing protein [Aphis craccivora]|uniref:DUF1758 domain-containing protein n=1 Tax=Aphis craccivora TaxID=307492 RepID=A0A6G0ZQI7_APHCR|nr:DUF1758 domain-containing protein [Aphis craccivora]
MKYFQNYLKSCWELQRRTVPVTHTMKLTLDRLSKYWDFIGTHIDTFGYRCNPQSDISYQFSALYDPIMTLGPMVFWAKALISSKWNIFITELTSLVYLKLFHHISIEKFIKAQLASKICRCFTKELCYNGLSTMHLTAIACKSKVALLKTSKIDKSLTIPRLELCVALLIASLLSHTMSPLKELVCVQNIKAFSDLTIVLAWLKTEPNDFKIFVLSQCEWSHLKPTENAADPASRGLLSRQLVISMLHLNSPEFLQQPEEQWSSQTLTRFPPEPLTEYKRPVKFYIPNTYPTTVFTGKKISTLKFYINDVICDLDQINNATEV